MAAPWGKISLLALEAAEHRTPREMLHSPLHKVTWPVRLLMQKHPNVLCSVEFANSSESNLQTALCRGGGAGVFSPLFPPSISFSFNSGNGSEANEQHLAISTSLARLRSATSFGVFAFIFKSLAVREN